MSEAINSLERLLRLRDAGALSEEEFQAQKTKILSASEPTNAEAIADSSSFTARTAGARRWAGTAKGKIVIGATLALFVTGVVGWWWFSPYWTLRNMQAALAARDADSFSRYVDFPSLRADLKADMLAESAEEARNGKQEGMGDGLAVLGAAMAGPMIDGMVSPDGLRVLFAMKNPDGRDLGIMSTAADGAEIVRTGLSEFQVKDTKGGVLIFTLKGLSWKLSAVDEAPKKPVDRGGNDQSASDDQFGLGAGLGAAQDSSPDLTTPPVEEATPELDIPILYPTSLRMSKEECSEYSGGLVDDGKALVDGTVVTIGRTLDEVPFQTYPDGGCRELTIDASESDG